MAALTQDRNTRRREGDEFVFRASKEIFAGALVCMTSGGTVEPASASGGVCVGVAREHALPGHDVRVRRGVFAVACAPGDLSRADVGATAYAADDQTVQKTKNACVAGVVLDVDAFGVWIRI